MVTPQHALLRRGGNFFRITASVHVGVGRLKKKAGSILRQVRCQNPFVSFVKD